MNNNSISRSRRIRRQGVRRRRTGKLESKEEEWEG